MVYYFKKEDWRHKSLKYNTTKLILDLGESRRTRGLIVLLSDGKLFQQIVKSQALLHVTGSNLNELLSIHTV